MKLSQLKQQIEELDAKATKGPWYVEDGGEFIATKKHGRAFDIAIVPDYLRQGEDANSDRDAELIALSRTALPELLRRLLVAEEAFGNILKMTAGHYGIDKTANTALKTIRGEE